ncbi:MAG: hypothetical protein AAFN18_11285 [Cyanobacteria bacterium J06554_6]
MLIWKTNTADARIASYRYRCLMPARDLAQQGYPSIIYNQGDPVVFPRQAQAIVFVKSFTRQDLSICQRAVDRGLPVILDLCDNIFIDTYVGKTDVGKTDGGRTPADSPRETFWTMAQLATAIVTTGPALQQAIATFLEKPPPIWIIPDGCETLESMQAVLRASRWQRFADLLRYCPGGFVGAIAAAGLRQIKAGARRLKSWAKWTRHYLSPYLGPIKRALFGALGLPVSPPVETEPTLSATAPDLPVPPAPPPENDTKTILWFGNHGAAYGKFGMVNILQAAPALERLSREYPLRLLVVSNHYGKYLDLIEPLPFPTAYAEWHPFKIYDDIAQSDAVIIPNSKTPFSLCKSANRAVLSLSLGVPVVATRTPAYEPLVDCVAFDDWYAGLHQYLSQPEQTQQQLARVQQVIQTHYSGTVIADRWRSMLTTLYT